MHAATNAITAMDGLSLVSDDSTAKDPPDGPDSSTPVGRGTVVDTAARYCSRVLLPAGLTTPAI